MNPYLNHFIGLLVLPELLKAGNVCYEDLPVLNQFRNPTTGKSPVCWAHVLGPCYFGIATLPQEVAIRNIMTKWTGLPTMW